MALSDKCLKISIFSVVKKATFLLLVIILLESNLIDEKCS